MNTVAIRPVRTTTTPTSQQPRSTVAFYRTKAATSGAQRTANRRNGKPRALPNGSRQA